MNAQQPAGGPPKSLSSASNPFDEWAASNNAGDGAASHNKLDALMRQVRPSVYDLPQNPMNHKSYKCNYIKARVETTRMDYIH